MIYVSDYYYAASNNYWTLPGYDTTILDANIPENKDYRAAIWDNWLWNGDAYWTITPREVSSSFAFLVSDIGDVDTFNVSTSTAAVRPSFYLNSNVEYVSGTGTEADPFIIR